MLIMSGKVKKKKKKYLGKVKWEEQPEEYKGRGIDVFMEVGLKAIETAVLLAVSGKNFKKGFYFLA